MKRDLRSLGYNFAWELVDSMRFMLPQRRNRVWAMASVDCSEPVSDTTIQTVYSECLMAMRGHFQFPVELNFPPTGVKEQPKSKRHSELIAAAKESSYCPASLFVDCQPSLMMQAKCEGGIPCVMPTHPVWCVEQERYLQAVDFLNAQGLWPCAFEESVYQKILATPKLAQSLAGTRSVGKSKCSKNKKDWILTCFFFAWNIYIYIYTYSLLGR